MAKPLHQIGTTIITVEEELSGWYTLLRRGKGHRELAQTYHRMTETIQALATLQLVTFRESAIDRFEDLRRIHPRIGRNDLRIAAIAMDAACVLVTRNRIDFQEIEGLSFVDWSR